MEILNPYCVFSENILPRLEKDEILWEYFLTRNNENLEFVCTSCGLDDSYLNDEVVYLSEATQKLIDEAEKIIISKFSCPVKIVDTMMVLRPSFHTEFLRQPAILSVKLMLFKMDEEGETLYEKIKEESEQQK